MMDNRYREELDRIRLTEESKGALICALTERREAPEGRPAGRPTAGQEFFIITLSTVSAACSQASTHFSR